MFVKQHLVDEYLPVKMCYVNGLEFDYVAKWILLS